MRVCLISNQIAAWGKIGGFGTATRALGHGLVKRGVEVHAVVVRRRDAGQGRLEHMDGIVVHGIAPWETLTSGHVFSAIDADIYHSQEPTLPSYFAQRVMPDRIHVVTCRDPRGWREHLTEFRYTSLSRRLMFPVTWLYEASPWVKRAVTRADVVLSPAPTALTARVQRLYGEDIEAEFMPYPVPIPPHPPRKAERPTVLFVGRFDRRKRLEEFFDLAVQFPEVEFIAVGRAHEEAYDRNLRQRYGQLANLHMPGFVSRFDSPGLSDYYERAWILVNTSAREGLPYTFLEAAGYGVALLSCLDPDSFASKFGVHVPRENYADGLRYLLGQDRWRSLGVAGMHYVKSVWNEDACIDKHLTVYQRLMHARTAGHCPIEG